MTPQVHTKGPVLSTVEGPLDWLKEKAAKIVGKAVKRDENAFDPLIRKYATRSDFPPHYVKGMIHVESAFNPEAKGPANEVGLMQFLPSTARSMGLDPDNLKDPETAIRAGTKYISQILDQYVAPALSVPVHPVLKTMLAQFGYTAGPTFLKELLRRYGSNRQIMGAPENFGQMVESLRGLAITDKFEKLVPNFLNSRKQVVSQYQYWAQRYAKDFGFEPYTGGASPASGPSSVAVPVLAAGVLGIVGLAALKMRK